MVLPDSENRVELGRIVAEISAFKKRYWPAGRPAAHTQFCPVSKKELRSALRAPLVIKVVSTQQRVGRLSLTRHKVIIFIIPITTDS